MLLKAEIDSTLVLVIDNLDRLTKDGDPYTDLEWFPRSFPSRCRFIISCTEGKLLLNIRCVNTTSNGLRADLRCFVRSKNGQ